MIYLAADHRGFESKAKIAAFLESAGHEVSDLGPHSYDKDDDYPDYAIPLAETVAGEDGARGILICGSGVGVTIAANKVKGARAGYIESVRHAEAARTDDDINILVLDEFTFSPETDFPIIEAFLGTPFSDEDRHNRRLQKISDYEQS
ncbi:MAG: putative ribose-5-phosphate isomerase B [candidate division WS6 bacterium OLB20]|uniref:Putative ribose-5-phosphate isomerase B n=1 Tax=candidate division WS6 bacterium OLB20 TaxID=1617426 RepID=A0A136LW29_9BACT|nr:MAG: putative ribose-5-phosphate isomerase B [candidate division WS6 bacterium OLB20]